MQSLRVALLPSADERASIVQSVWCESLETVIYLTWSMRHPDFPGRFVCPCGHGIDADWDAIDEVSGQKQDT